MFKTKEKIRFWLELNGVRGYAISDDLSVDVYGNVDLEDKRLTEIPIQFRTVSGHFDCRHNKLTSLKGCPTTVMRYFNCSSNQLTSLEHCPKFIKGGLRCQDNPITDLSNFSCEFEGFFIHSGKPIPEYESLYVERETNVHKILMLEIRHTELIKAISKVELMKELSYLKSNDTKTKKPKV